MTNNQSEVSKCCGASVSVCEEGKGVCSSCNKATDVIEEWAYDLDHASGCCRHTDIKKIFTEQIADAEIKAVESFITKLKSKYRYLPDVFNNPKEFSLPEGSYDVIDVKDLEKELAEFKQSREGK